MNNKTQKGWWVALLGIIIAIMIQMMLINESYQYEKSVFTNTVDTGVDEAIYKLNSVARVAWYPRMTDVFSLDWKNKQVLIRKDGDLLNFEIEENADKTKVNNQLQYEIRDTDKWNLQELNSIFQEILKDNKLVVPVEFTLTDISSGKVIDHYAEGTIGTWGKVQAQPIKLGFITQHSLLVDYEFPLGYYWSVAAERLYVAGFFFVVLLLCVYLLLRTIASERKTRLYKEKLVHSLVHNLKNPVAVCMVTIETTARKISSEGWEGKIDIMLATLAKQMEKLGYGIDELLSTGTDANGLRLDVQKVEIACLADDLLEFFNPLFRARKNAQFQVSLDVPDDEYIPIDQSHVHGALSNLVGNALKYSKEDGALVSLSFYREGKYLIISVKDNGIGIAEEDKKRIFEAGYRVRSNADGHGIGLYYVQMVVKAHHGKISVNSEVGQGSEFIMALPLKRRWWWNF